jgi:hypothetical protein
MVASELGRCGLEASVSTHVLAAKTGRASHPRISGMGILQKEEEPDCEFTSIHY